jgi:hypothetical protein
LIRDQGAIVKQLGLDAKQYAADLIQSEGGSDHCVQPLTPASDKVGGYQARGNDNEYGQRYADILNRIMQAELSAIPMEYDRACQQELPGGLAAHGHGDADQFWMGLRSALPDAKFQIDHVIGLNDTGQVPRAALRWSLHGKHSGWGTFGNPTGAEIYVLGISHAEFGPRGLNREFVLYDETAVWKQILLHTG